MSELQDVLPQILFHKISDFSDWKRSTVIGVKFIEQSFQVPPENGFPLTLRIEA
jgi:hypothetical protein